MYFQINPIEPDRMTVFLRFLRHPLREFETAAFDFAVARTQPMISHGIPVYIQLPLGADLSPSAVHGALDGALTILAASEPQMMKLLVRFRVRVVASDYWRSLNPSGAYNRFAKVIQLNVRTFMAPGEEQAIHAAAATIVHEATHARVDFWLRGRAPCAAADKHRIERLCHLRQLAFVQRIPNTEPIQEHLRYAIAMIPQTYSRRAWWRRFARTLRLIVFATGSPKK